MKCCRISVLCLGLLLVSSAWPAEQNAETQPVRTWTDSTGQFQVRAWLLELQSQTNTVVLRKPHGITTRIPLQSLSAEDQQFVQQHQSSPTAHGSHGGVRTWTDEGGLYQVKAAFVGLDQAKGDVLLATPAGKRLRCNLQRLSQADRSFVVSRSAAVSNLQTEQPHLYVHLSQSLIDKFVQRQVDEPTEIDEEILETKVTGHGWTSGLVQLQLAADDCNAAFDVVFQGQVQSQTIGRNGPVRIHTNSTAYVQSRKRVVVGPSWVHLLPACSEAHTDSHITGLETDFSGVLDWVVRRVAEQRIEDQKPEADQIATRRTKRRFNERMNRDVSREVRQRLAQLRELVQKEDIVREVLRTRVRLSSSFNDLTLELLPESSTTITEAPPERHTHNDLAVRVHQSAIDELLARRLAGETLPGDDFDSGDPLLNLFLKLDPLGGKEFSVTLADERPITVELGDAQLAFTIRGRFAAGQRAGDMNVTLRYALEADGPGLDLVLSGEPKIEPPRFEQGAQGGLSGREVIFRRVLANMLKESLRKRIPKDALWKLSLDKLEDRWGTDLDWLEPTKLQTQPGWLQVHAKISN